MRTVNFRDVGKLLCLGRNYPEHAKEMKAEVPGSPVVFIKPATALVQSGGDVIIPSLSKEAHYEVEMVVLIGKEGKNISKDAAFDHVAGYAVGLDMTLRDIQAEAKKMGLPWSALIHRLHSLPSFRKRKSPILTTSHCP